MDEFTDPVEIRFVGGPLHGTETLMANPEFRMELGGPGESIEYCRRLVEVSEVDGTPHQIATYAPYGMSEDDFTRLAIEVSALSARNNRPGPAGTTE